MPDVKNDFATIDISSHTIKDVMNNIESQKMFLPCIQRDFIWETDRIYKLLDSIMRGFPIGTIMIWETDEQVNYRYFETNYSPANVNNDFMPVDDNETITRQYVLDGQQRLQSLYIALRGSYNNRKLFFDLRSAPSTYYFFNFQNPRVRVDGWINVRNFLQKTFNSEDDIRNELISSGIISSDCTPDERDLMSRNAKRLYDVFKEIKNIPIQKLTNVQLQDIAEIFIRTNSGGIVLVPEDLIMATITGRWISEDRRFSELMDNIARLGFNNPRGFIIQACCAMLLQVTGNNMAIHGRFDEVRCALAQNAAEINDSIVDVLDIVSQFDAVRRFATPHNNPIFILIAYRYAHGKDQWEAHKDV